MQVTNWFINARVRLWKPMVEDMYQQEAKEEEERERGEGSNSRSQSHKQEISTDENDPSSSFPRLHHQQELRFTPNETTTTTTNQQHGGGIGIGTSRSGSSFPDLIGFDAQGRATGNSTNNNVTAASTSTAADEATYGGAAGIVTPPGATHIRFGTSGDVSLTLGLRHAGNLPDSNRFSSLRDFNG